MLGGARTGSPHTSEARKKRTFNGAGTPAKLHTHHGEIVLCHLLCESYQRYDCVKSPSIHAVNGGLQPRPFPPPCGPLPSLSQRTCFLPALFLCPFKSSPWRRREDWE
jgi:hypothetical protein